MVHHQLRSLGGCFVGSNLCSVISLVAVSWGEERDESEQAQRVLSGGRGEEGSPWGGEEGWWGSEVIKADAFSK